MKKIICLVLACLMLVGMLGGCSSEAPNTTTPPTPPTQPTQTSSKTIIKCFACGEEWEFDDSKIPVGERYEATCPKCQMKLRRKKV